MSAESKNCSTKGLKKKMFQHILLPASDMQTKLIHCESDVELALADLLGKPDLQRKMSWDTYCPLLPFSQLIDSVFSMIGYTQYPYLCIIYYLGRY